MEDKITALKDVVGGNDPDEIKKRTEALTGELNTLSQKLYAQTGAQAGAQPGAEAQAGAGQAQGDDVVDADYEVVDDDNKEEK